MQADEGLGEDVGEGDGQRSGQPVPGRHDENQPVAPVGPGFEAGQTTFVSNDADIHLPGSDRVKEGQTYQQLEKMYFEYGDLGFPAFRGGLMRYAKKIGAV